MEEVMLVLLLAHKTVLLIKVVALEVPKVLVVEVVVLCLVEKVL
jgi:hypothetical protein